MKKIKTKQKITLVDVAKEAGVSAITVSRTIRSPHMVSPKAREKVEAAVDALGYVPDAAASALASNRTDVIGLLIPSLTNSVFAEVLRGMYDEIEGTPYSIQIGNYRYSPLTEEKLIRTFLCQKPAGLIVAGLDQTETSRKLLMEASCPIVQIMEFDKGPVDSMIGFSHFEAGAAATRHLIEQGYERIGFLGARMDPRSQRRLAGFRQELKSRGSLSAERTVTTPEASSVGLGAELLRELLVRAPDTDAIFCNNDDLAIGALLEAQRRGIRIPEDFGICGFNDLEISKQLNPGLTSVATPRYRIGGAAIKTIVRSLETDSVTARKRLDLGFEVIPRGSSILNLERKNAQS
ncbi:LacI family DNA-binding transcriptional regulator [Pseudohalocynthiibacter aestuariivivens]|jgi:LacI family transcriptional regulator, gluconate utilization system Gnt-I transcriptional repressor|uniref:LacI family DNA-binding transcriptional regulator n=1 Tax=Pseudohalocynthiibacter aestuariivivens TaxID=1591409 RepID=A0ABV5JFK9_9RHOB|nr:MULTISPECIES: LacI family DNA-binding transcriptional regulator [Pseudohalocynthiibacter]MBS9718069.1 LacI family DNA-binding transcriptional regulator [Pseudohalocynthiibacter aestuariivivens]MCK0103278.1 LacI family DNA-binding transcriptional regulator [Pseudohalocynthiibacter sp. F2068]